MSEQDLEVYDEKGLSISRIGGLTTIENKTEEMVVNREYFFDISPEIGEFAVPMWDSNFTVIMLGMMDTHIEGSVVKITRRTPVNTIKIIRGRY